MKTLSRNKSSRSINFLSFSMHTKSVLRPGFALIATMSVMALLVMIAIAMLSLSTVEIRSSNQTDSLQKARQNARMALLIAISELQEAAGSDQRVTATASILANNGALAPVQGHEHWVGVWDTSNYSAARPNEKTFVKWLVSSSNPSDIAEEAFASNPSNRSTPIYADSVSTPVVDILNDEGVATGNYSYWIEDEGVKADLGWQENEVSSAERQQTSRLGAAPGPDYSLLEGPFSTGVSHPIGKDSSGEWLANIAKAISVNDAPIVMGQQDSFEDWMELRRHDITLGSEGVLSNTKLGGLRRDLSLAFEMDDEAEAAGAINFNLQDGEFVGGSDILASPVVMGALPVPARYLHRESNSSGGLFSSDIPSGSTVRGPNWWALRDYANLYKRLSGTVGDYSLDARPALPNFISASSDKDFSDIGTFQGLRLLDNLFVNRNTIGITSYLYRHSQPAYAPALIGQGALISVGEQNSNVALFIDPYYVIWNPYNHRITTPRFVVATSKALPINLKVAFESTPLNYVGRATEMADYIEKSSVTHLGRAGNGDSGPTEHMTASIDDLVMEPGEVAYLTRDPNQNTGDPTVSLFNSKVVKGFHIDTGTGYPIFQFVKGFSNRSNIWGTLPIDTLQTLDFTVTPIFNPNDATFTHTFLDDQKRNDILYFKNWNHGPPVQSMHISMKNVATESLNVGAQAVSYNRSELSTSRKNYFAAYSLLAKPAKFDGALPTPVQTFAQFNPISFTSSTESDHASGIHQELEIHSDRYADIGELLSLSGIDLPASNTASFWGPSYKPVGSTGNLGGTTAVPLLDLPSSPIHSLVSFTHANLGIRAHEPINAVGNSLATPFVDPLSPYGLNANDFNNLGTASYDSSWLMNDALFDDYYLSGLAPGFSITAAGYSANTSMAQTLTAFFSGSSNTGYLEAAANPVIAPYRPQGVSAEQIIDELDPASNNDGYRKLGAYSMVRGSFNINSTSVLAWEAMLRGNRGLDLTYTDGTKDTGGADTTPFPSGVAPSKTSSSEEYWAGARRLNDSQIKALAIEIVNQVRLRGPFMSISDFVNHRVGTPKLNETHYKGALQAAIDNSGINSDVQTVANGTSVDYNNVLSENFVSPIQGAQPTTTNIPGDITQAKVLLPLAPRISARSDTFRIRTVGEAWSEDGERLLARASCEAVVQRTPTYMDTTTDPANNEPWDDSRDSSSSTLNSINERLGRRFEVVRFRWLSKAES